MISLLEKITTRLMLAKWILSGDIIVCYKTKTGEIIGAITDTGTLYNEGISMELVGKEHIDYEKYRVKIEELKRENNDKD